MLPVYDDMRTALLRIKGMAAVLLTLMILLTTISTSILTKNSNLDATLIEQSDKMLAWVLEQNSTVYNN